jgi:Ca-activated chloride channel family protein
VRLQWPLALLTLLLPLALVLAYLWARRRRRKYAVTFTSLTLVKDAMGTRSRWRRWVPPALLLAAMAMLVIATARPQALVTTSRSDTTIMLTMDVSRSMCSTDVAPNRLAAAQAAARKFVHDQPGGARIGLVAFAGSAQLLVPPTDDRDRLLNAIDGFSTAFGTAIGDGILESIDALSEVNPAIAPGTVRLSPSQRRNDRFASRYVPDIVILLTDGAATAGIDPLVAARQARDRGVRVFTIGFGTTNPTAIVCTPAQIGGDTVGGQFGGGQFDGNAVPPQFRGGAPGAGGRRGFLEIDEPALKAIAKTTGGKYARAATAGQLEKAFDTLPTRIKRVREVHELTVYLVALGALLAIGALATSRWWNRTS